MTVRTFPCCTARKQFARPVPAPGVHFGVKALGEFILVIVGVEIGTQVNVALGAPQRPEVLEDVVGFRITVDHRSYHEGVVDDLAAAKLFREIVGSIEQSDGGRFAGQKELQTAKKHPFLK